MNKNKNEDTIGCVEQKVNVMNYKVLSIKKHSNECVYLWKVTSGKDARLGVRRVVRLAQCKRHCANRICAILQA